MLTLEKRNNQNLVVLDTTATWIGFIIKILVRFWQQNYLVGKKLDWVGFGVYQTKTLTVVKVSELLLLDLGIKIIWLGYF